MLGIRKKARYDNLNLYVVTIHSGFQYFFILNPSNIYREATQATPEMRRVLKVMIYGVKALYLALLGTLGSIF